MTTFRELQVQYAEKHIAYLELKRQTEITLELDPNNAMAANIYFAYLPQAQQKVDALANAIHECYKLPNEAILQRFGREMHDKLRATYAGITIDTILQPAYHTSVTYPLPEPKLYSLLVHEIGDRELRTLAREVRTCELLGYLIGEKFVWIGYAYEIDTLYVYERNV